MLTLLNRTINISPIYTEEILADRGAPLPLVAAHVLQLRGRNSHLDLHPFEEHVGLTRRSVMQVDHGQ